MSTVSKIMTELKKRGSEQTRNIYAKHGLDLDCFGVKVGDLKDIAKKIKGEQDLACELYETGNSDAMYLAGLVADGSKMTKRQLDSWAKNSKWYMISEYTVPFVAHENPAARDLALKWMKSRTEHVAASGWSTYVGVIATRADEDLDLAEIKNLLSTVEQEISSAKNRVKYAMNGFVIAVGAYVKPLLKQAKKVAKKIGKVDVEMGTTACKVPLATEYIEKIESTGRIGKKRKTLKC
ncbi:MAG: DNA alkylation repair protein [Planctomycetota bacterium]